jgi:hypothetical protein
MKKLLVLSLLLGTVFATAQETQSGEAVIAGRFNVVSVPMPNGASPNIIMIDTITGRAWMFCAPNEATVKLGYAGYWKRIASESFYNSQKSPNSK